MKDKDLVPFTPLTVLLSDATKHLVYIGQTKDAYLFTEEGVIDSKGVIIDPLLLRQFTILLIVSKKYVSENLQK